MDSQEYYTVPEIAYITGLTKQAIYKRLSTSLSPYVTIIEGKKHLHRNVLKVLMTNSRHDKLNDTDNNDQTLTEIVASMNKMIDLLRVQLAAKDKQIEEVNATLSQAIKNQGMSHYNEAVKQIEAPKTPWYKRIKNNSK